MISKVEKYIKTHIITPKNILVDKPHVLVGLSGGPDSVSLLHIFVAMRDRYQIKLSAAHLNHGWRKEAETDMLFCKNLCEKLNVPFFSSHANDLQVSIKKNGSLEEVGRKLRRVFFTQIKEQISADYIALAHHQQDQQETFFLRIIRGCSLSGLVGIRPVQLPYIRPLLCVSKLEILEYLKKNNLSYVVDQSNESDAYLRNRIRKYLLPQLQNVDPRFDKKFASTMKTLQEENDILQTIAYRAYIETNGDLKTFRSLDEPIQKRILVEWLSRETVPFTPSQAYLAEILRFLLSPRGGTHKIHQQWSINKKKDRFWLEKH